MPTLALSTSQWSNEMAALIKSLKWMTYGALALVAAIALCWWLIPDEALNPEAAGFVSQATVPPSARNASFMIWGLPASPELDAHMVGRRIVAAQDRLESAQKDTRDFSAEDYLGANPLTLPTDLKPLCDAERENCLKAYQNLASEVEQEVANRNVFLDRYRNIRNYEEFVSANSKISEVTTIPNWRPILRMSELVNGQIAINMQSRNRQEAALHELASEVASWRRILASNDWVITQMIAVIALHRKYRLASEIMNAYPNVVFIYPELMQSITKPIPTGEANLVSAIKTEGRVNMQFLWDMGLEKQLPNGGGYYDEFFSSVATKLAYQSNASINDSYGVFKLIVAQLNKSPREFLQTQEAFKESLAEKTNFRLIDIFYNSAGRFGQSTGFPDFSKYMFRMYDLVGLSRLVDLQRTLIASKVPPHQVAGALTTFGHERTNPYTEQPMQWNAQSSQLSFELHGKRFANFGFVDVNLAPGTQ
jgi:hypothetical protein